MGLGWPQSAPIIDAAALPPLIPRMRRPLRASLIGARRGARRLRADRRARCGAWRSAPSARTRRPRALPASRSPRRWSASRLLSGALAGLAGVGEVAGLKGYLTSDLSPGFGYAGIVVAMLAGLSPLGVVAGGDLRRRRLRRRRFDEPRHSACPATSPTWSSRCRCSACWSAGFVTALPHPLRARHAPASGREHGDPRHPAHGEFLGGGDPHRARR